MSFADKVVIVTGASSGIGAATAKLFAEHNAKVVMVGRNIEKLNNVEDDIKQTTNAELLVITADISNEDEARRVIEKTVAHFEKIDVLVNNAGFGAVTSILDTDFVNKLDNMFATNLRAVAILIHAAAPHLIKTKGNIVNVSSIASICSLKTFSAYATTKAALDHLSRCLAVELAEHDVRVNVVNPGPVSTDFVINAGGTKELSDQIYKDTAKTLPLKRVSESIEIAEVILFMASNKGRSITGTNYVIDCGGALSRQ